MIDYSKPLSAVTTFSADQVTEVARHIWVGLNDQRVTGTFGFQPPHVQQRYIRAALEVCAFLGPALDSSDHHGR